MGSWGVRSYENDDADFALDAGFDRVHGATYEDLMDDDNPLTIDQIQRRLANPATLEAAIAALVTDVDRPWDDWEDESRLAFAGVVVRHAELGVPIPADWRTEPSSWLRDEAIEWDEVTVRKLGASARSNSSNDRSPDDSARVPPTRRGLRLVSAWSVWLLASRHQPRPSEPLDAPVPGDDATYRPTVMVRKGPALGNGDDHRVGGGGDLDPDRLARRRPTRGRCTSSCSATTSAGSGAGRSAVSPRSSRPRSPPAIATPTWRSSGSADNWRCRTWSGSPPRHRPLTAGTPVTSIGFDRGRAADRLSEPDPPDRSGRHGPRRGAIGRS